MIIGLLSECPRCWLRDSNIRDSSVLVRVESIIHLTPEGVVTQASVESKTNEEITNVREVCLGKGFAIALFKVCSSHSWPSGSVC